MKKAFFVSALAAALLVLAASAGRPVVRPLAGTAAAAAAAAPTPRLPIRPVSGGINFGFNKRGEGASKPHNGIDYASSLGNSIKSVGKGVVHRYTKPNASGFGSWIPNFPGPAIWVRYKLATGEPIYVLYGHSSSSYSDKTKTGKSFSFNCTYKIDLWVGQTVEAGAPIAKTAPFYNSGRAAMHLHVSVFKPARKKDGTYYDVPTSGWGYSDVNVPEGTYINPEDFFTKSQYKLAPNP